MRRHNRRLFRVTRSVLRDSGAAQDAVQETYLRAFTQPRHLSTHGKVRRLAHARGAQRGADDAAARARRHRVARRRRRGRRAAGRGRRPLTRPRPTSSSKRRYARALLEHAIDALPENFRMVFVLRVVEGLDVRETAECLELNPTTVRTRLFRAQRLLRGELSRRLRGESTEIFDFGAERCDRVVERVLENLRAARPTPARALRAESPANVSPFRARSTR